MGYVHRSNENLQERIWIRPPNNYIGIFPSQVVSFYLQTVEMNLIELSGEELVPENLAFLPVWVLNSKDIQNTGGQN